MNDNNQFNRKTYKSKEIDLQTMLHRLERTFDQEFYPVGSTYSPYAALTPCSNASGGGYARPQNFPMNLLSPNSPVPTQPFGLSPKILERAHQIPERFWIDWQQKQLRNNLISPEKIDASNRRKSLLLLHELQRRLSVPRGRFPDDDTPSEPISTTSSLEDVAQIDTELKLIFLSHENANHTNPLLYSGAVVNRSVVFREKFT